MSKNIYLFDQSSKSYELVLSEHLLLLGKNDIVNIPLIYPTINWVIMLIFRTDNITKAGDAKVIYDGNVIKYTLTNWHSDTFMENAKPFILKGKETNNEFQIKLRTSATINSDFRDIQITIWKVN